jgi:hypothetical protein
MLSLYACREGRMFCIALHMVVTAHHATSWMIDMLQTKYVLASFDLANTNMLLGPS